MQYGGSFAPPLSAAQLSDYELLASQAPPEVADAMGVLVRCCRKFAETGESTEPTKAHPSGRGLIQKLSAEEVQRIWDWVPWKHELTAFGTVFDPLPSGPLRNAAFHLLWFGFELTADRQPCTSDLV